MTLGELSSLLDELRTKQDTVQYLREQQELHSTWSFIWKDQLLAAEAEVRKLEAIELKGIGNES